MTRAWGSGVAVLLVALAACELEETTLVEVEDVVIAEVYANVASDPDNNEIHAFLHRTVGLDGTGVADLLQAVVTIDRGDGLSIRLQNAQAEDCLETFPREDPGACFVADPAQTALLRAGDLLELEISLQDGGSLTGAARLPGTFDLAGLEGTCRVPPDVVLDIVWSRSERAWAYLNETSIRGLPEALRAEGIRVDDDPLYLLGLSISDADTTIAFPSQFGVFNRFDLDQDLAVRLQRGLPEGGSAEIAITALDRNYVNWSRGGNFNPSGQVRVPSLQGEGTGVFGASVVRRFNVVATADPTSPAPPCPIG